jgi:hypothetical protein
MRLVPIVFVAVMVSCKPMNVARKSIPGTATAPVHKTCPAFVDPTHGYLVVRIDSLQSVYLVYARRSDTLYKVVSDKASVPNCQKLQVGQQYQLQLWSLHFTDAPSEELARYSIMATVGHIHSGGID